MSARNSPGKPRVLVTGANGFVGRNLCVHLGAQGWIVRASVRRTENTPAGVAELAVTGELDGTTDWREALQNVDAVVHCAARVHVLKETAANPLDSFRRVNVAGSENLARHAAAAGIGRFVFLSSIGARIAESDTGATAYQISKLEAERALETVRSETRGATGRELTLTLLRPPLIYGPGAPGNFALLIKAIERGLPLPLASIDNRRAFLYVGNLCDAIRHCLQQDTGGLYRYELADGPGVSTPQLIRELATALHRPARLWPCPVALLRIAGILAGRSGTIERLTGSLILDNAPICEGLGWTPPWDLHAGLAASFAGRAGRKQPPTRGLS